MPGWIIAVRMKMKNNMDLIDFDLLKAHAIKKPKEFLYSHPEYRLSIWEWLKLKYFIFLRNHGYSVAAITKHKEFYGLDFFVNKHVLIPRPDTELMVTEVIEEIKKTNEKITLVDVGTGSSCIPISVLKNLPEPVPTYAIDISSQALKVAKKNAENYGIKIQFLRGNLLEPILQKISGKIISTANLPYLTEQQFKNEPSIAREPKNALVAKNNGLALYEELLQQIKTSGLDATIFLEIDPSQTEAINKLITKYLPESKIEIKKDLGGLNRLVKIS
ncbi:MAG: release factor glutamine methyltransferase [Parcubacteria group bacterium Gr01-1014_13]|nr:MAG: release factor glutamine methyltransferase [Parcubacteria group bacterium Gr01-1014_13]